MYARSRNQTERKREREDLATTMKILGRRWIRSGWRREREEGRRCKSDGSRSEARARSARIKGSPGRGESVGGIPLAPRDDTTTSYLEIAAELSRRARARACTPSSFSPEIIPRGKIGIAYLSRYFVTRFAHASEADLLSMIDRMRISNCASTAAVGR